MYNNWVHTDEAQDVAGSIRHLLRAMEFVSEDPLEWKWVALALHLALQGACVCHLTTTAAPIGAVTRANAREWLTYFERSRTEIEILPPKTRMMPLPDLLKAIRRPRSAGDQSNSEGVPINDAELEMLEFFHNEVRNQFVHFCPKGWSIELSGMPIIIGICVRIIADIDNIGWGFRHMDLSERARMRADLHRII